jgi:hypothetical protein
MFKLGLRSTDLSAGVFMPGKPLLRLLRVPSRVQGAAEGAALHGYNMPR